MRPGPEWYRTVRLLHRQEGDEYYLVADDLHQDLQAELVLRRLFLVATALGDFFLWPGPVREDKEGVFATPDSATDLAQRCAGDWIRVRWSRAEHRYEVSFPQDDVPAPTWPAESYDELADIAFRGRTIDSLDHPVVRRLQGRSRR